MTEENLELARECQRKERNAVAAHIISEGRLRVAIKLLREGTGSDDWCAQRDGFLNA